MDADYLVAKESTGFATNSPEEADKVAVELVIKAIEALAGYEVQALVEAFAAQNLTKQHLDTPTNLLT